MMVNVWDVENVPVEICLAKGQSFSTEVQSQPGPSRPIKPIHDPE